MRSFLPALAPPLPFSTVRPAETGGQIIIIDVLGA